MEGSLVKNQTKYKSLKVGSSAFSTQSGRDRGGRYSTLLHNTAMWKNGGWYILRNSWNYADFDYKEVLKELHVNYGVTPFFKIAVEADPFSPGSSTIRISPSGLGLPDKEYYYREEDDRVQGAYKELIRDVIKYLSTTRDEAEKFGNDIFHYEKRIAEVTPDTNKLQNPINTCNHITISELKETMLTIPFYDILTAMYPEANLGETTEVVITSVEYLTEVSQIIASTDRRTMNGYLMWTLTRHYLPYLSQKFTSALHNFEAELFGVHQSLPRWETCANVVQKFMGLAVNVMSEKNDPISNETHRIINETYHSIVAVAKSKLSSFKSMPHLHMHLVQKLENLQLQVGLPEAVKKTAYIKEFYKKLNVLKSNLFKSVLFGFAFKKRLEERRLIKTAPEDEVISYLDDEEPEVVYSPANSMVIVPRSLLSSPFFESKYPKSIIYGRIGVEIASAVMSAILPYQSFWTSGRKLLTQYHVTGNESLNSISNSRDCLYKYILNLNLDVPYDVANQTSLLTLKHLSAIKVANEALASLPSSPHIHQPALAELEDSALYFLSYAQTQCSESTNQFQVYENVAKFRLPQRLLLHVVFAQLPEFSEALDCSFSAKSQCPSVF